VLATELPDLILPPLTKSAAPELHTLLQKNRDHLTAHGDYAEQVAMSCDQVEAELASDSGNRRFGIVMSGVLIGRIDLVAADPPKYGVGYWLAKEATGRGYASAALRALIGHARIDLHATDIYAGVTRGNAKSEALLERLGFLPILDFESYRRFHLNLR
jgi:RimJ/RimL family protein N-acetyltransferase